VTYAKIILALVSLAGSLAKFFERQGYLKDGERKAILDAMQKEAQDVGIALKARADARRAHELNPDWVRDDDGFKRPD
jgi:hypothetical protein